MQVLIVILLFIISSSSFAQQNMQLINWFAGADVVGTTGNTDTDQPSDFYVREFEFSAYSNIDQTWEGVLTFAYHRELAVGSEHMEVHEAFLNSSNLIPLSNIKIGKFFLGFGRLNRFHRHDWVFTDAPMIQKALFGNEGVKDTGIEYKRNLPDLTSTISIGITKGNEFNHTASGHNHSEDEEEEFEQSKGPTAYMRFAKFYEYSTTEGLEVALNVINRHDPETIKHQYGGLDLIYKDRMGKVLNWLVQSEIWYHNETHTEDDEEENFFDLGGYLYIEKGVDQHHAYGLRFDFYKPKEAEEGEDPASYDGVTADNEYKAVGLSYIYTNSEFMRTRYTVEYGNGVIVADDPDVDSFVRGHIQFVFSIGAHPAHIY